MSILPNFLLEAWNALTPSEWVMSWVQGGVGSTRTKGGKNVSPESALTFAAVYRAVSLISGQTATLPLHVYKRVSDTERERVHGHIVEELFNGHTNDEMDALTFLELVVSWVPLWGNGYAWIEREGPRVKQLWPLFPWNMEVKRKSLTESRSPLVYRYTQDNGQIKEYDPSDILHLKNLSRDGILGRSIVTHARESIGLGITQQEFMASFYENNATPSGALISKARLTRKKQKELRGQWKGMHGGPEKAGEIAVLHGDMDFKPFGMSMIDAQFLENRKANVLEVARMFGVPPHLLFDLDRATFSNIEAQGIEWLTYGLRYWLTKVARVASELFTTAEKDAGFYCEHETKALLMTDIVSRFNAYNTGLQAGFLSVNDVHRFENWPPIGDAGNIYRVQSNMVPADDLLVDFETRNPPKPAAIGPPSPRTQEAPSDLADKCLAVLNRAWARMLKREVWNVQNTAKRPGEFLERIEAYYAEHEFVLAEELADAIAAYAAASGQEIDAAGLAAAHCAESQRRLLDLAGRATAAELLAATESETTTWTERRPQWEEGALCLSSSHS